MVLRVVSVWGLESVTVCGGTRCVIVLQLDWIEGGS